MELYEGIGVSFAAIGKDSIRELQAGAAQSKVCNIYISTRRSN